MYNVNLVLTAELAADYFSLRELDAETQVVQESVDIQQKGLQLVENRHAGGVASGLDLAQQQTLLDSTVTQLYLVQQQRAQFEHAIAVLTGNAGLDLQRSGAPLNATPPAGSAGRAFRSAGAAARCCHGRAPDGVSKMREVGVATAAFYPQLTLSGSGGFQSTNITNLISAPSAIWSLGGDLLQPIFQGGRNRANLAATKAAYDESVANYREAVLIAFQQVEDGLSGLNALSQATTSQNAAVSDARRALEIANNRYVGGVTYVPRRHHRAVGPADQRAAGDAAARPADGDVGVSGESARRRLGCVADPERASASQGDPGDTAVGVISN